LKNKLFEKGGEYYRGFIVKTYQEDSTSINVDIQVQFLVQNGKKIQF
jgi:hypothetical protein